ncbi:response regulator transcription factor [Rheinheimera sp. F8]|uniref:response regulator transcription factor n=1 Tax=Rheinheimera sp. F8 TaxID=1763998 RepID=UPI0007448596|nr:response regulator transcription factor [Rheinheimera sp. F8]ALZ77294.1 hypothetical protein ATY27_17035 [Rheinheimera sp. F8]
MAHHILLLEDDHGLARLTSALLTQEGYHITWCTHAHRAEQLLCEQKFDLLLCDVLLPGSSGFDFVKSIRSQYQGPVLFMTAQTQLKHQLYGFELGAQDYLLKPLEPQLLLAKLRVFLPAPQVEDQSASFIDLYNLQLDLHSRTAILAGEPLELTSAEFKLLAALAGQFGKVVSRNLLFQQHLGRAYDGIDRTMDGRASRLRKKLQSRDLAWNVVTAWGEGYYLSYDQVEKT